MQLEAFIVEVRRLQSSEFAYPHSRKALDRIDLHFSDHLEALNQLSTDSHAPTVRVACAAAYSALEEYLPLLGFIIGSTDVRNAFEIYAPLLRIARRILGLDTGLIVSSQWDFTPFTYIGFPQLPEFVLIGLPATESGNPLLVPLSGHELGHSIWQLNSCEDLYRPEIEQVILAQIVSRWKEYEQLYPSIKQSELETGMFARQTWALSSAWAIRQAEELFCDFTGLRLFGESYLHAFAYFLSGKQEGQRSANYPNTKDRVERMRTAAEQYKLDVFPGYADTFADLKEPRRDEVAKSFFLSIADTASRAITQKMAEHVDRIVSSALSEQRSREEIEKCKGSFRVMVPAQNSKSIANILNAAWEVFLTPDFWGDTHHDELKKRSLLSEIVLKSFEVFEIENLLLEEP